jgi:hypothetical protein
VIYVIEGQLDTERKHGRMFNFKAGMGYQLSNFGDSAHRSSTDISANLFIAD